MDQAGGVREAETDSLVRSMRRKSFTIDTHKQLLGFGLFRVLHDDRHLIVRLTDTLLLQAPHGGLRQRCCQHIFDTTISLTGEAVNQAPATRSCRYRLPPRALRLLGGSTCRRFGTISARW